MAACTEGTLDKLSKSEIIGTVLSFQDKVEACNIANTDALEKICKFSENFVKSESELNLVKKVNALLNKRVVDMERKCLEVVGIPRDVFNEDLECKVLQVFTKAGFEIP